MKKNRFYYKLLCGLALPLFLLSCDGDEDGASAPSIDFSGISSTYYESTGTTTVTIPVRTSSAVSGDNLDFEFAGTATEGEDFEFVGFTAEGVQLSLIDDAKLETNETIRIRMVSPNLSLTGNNIHTVTIVSNCEDLGGLEVSYFAGEYDAVEDYGAGGTYGPYEIELVQDDTDPNMFHFDNLYDSGCDSYMVFDIAAGTVHFPDQSPCGVPLTNSSGTFTLCGDETLIINLNFDGGDWVYRFSKL